MTTQNLVNEFLGQKRFAMIGVSRHPRDFSRTLFSEFLKRGYDVVPVNPHATDINGKKPFASIRDVVPPVTGALLMLPSLFLKQTLTDCVEAGVTLAWIYGIMGDESTDPHIIKFCEDRGIRVIAGHCPYMFLSEAAMYHRIHGWAWKMVGYYPK